MTVADIVRDWLREHGYDGLYVEDDCACDLDDLAPCQNIQLECEAGYKHPCPTECDDDHEFHISDEKP